MSQTPLGARKDGDWYAICIEPSITRTPIGPVQVPLPYQVFMDLSQATATASTVQLNGSPAFLLDQSKMQRCMGDEQGTGGGVRSGTTSKEVKPVAGSGSVQINGKRAIRHGDPCTLNKENCQGKFMASAASIGNTEQTTPKRVRVHILPRNPVAAAGNIVPLDVITSPKGGTLQWKLKGAAKLIDRSGRPCSQGQEVFIKGSSLADSHTIIEVHVSVTYQHSDGTATAKTTLYVPPFSSSPPLSAPTLEELATSAEDEKQWTSGGFRVMGSGEEQLAANKKKTDITIACFIDGTGNSLASGSNIFLMYDGIRKHEGKWPNDAVIDAGYFAGPGARNWDKPGLLIGTGSRAIAERAYRSIADQCQQYLEEGEPLPHIDIYGFSRGAAIANELAWFISDRGIKDEDGRFVVPPREAPIRFLGLFDTVHSMERPGRDTSTAWHNTTIAPAVQHCAHALAANEERVYFIPSFVQRIGTGEKVKELIFPGVHSDVGGFKGYNKDLMKLSRSWMSEQATSARVFYLKQHIIPESEQKAILADPNRRKPSPEGQANYQTNLLNYEEKRREFANKFWGYDAQGNPPGLQYALRKVIISTALPETKVIIPGNENLKNQPHEMHKKRIFPKRIHRLLTES